MKEFRGAKDLDMSVAAGSTLACVGAGNRITNILNGPLAFTSPAH